ncbi:uncharacterized protein [Heterodontus francisci]|uniref:uncharacterized protein n=1 Tax=Heterodontus francisci TaxID=7792 RepID=UPI00355B3185
MENAICKVVNEEKAQEICNIIDAYIDRCKIFASNKEKLCEEAQIYERDLFNQLKRVSNAMLHNPQIATVTNFYLWLEGASYNLKMLLQMVLLGVRDLNEVHMTAKIHSSTMSKLGSAVRNQKSLVIKLIPHGLCTKLTDKEVGQSVWVFHPCINSGEIKTKYLGLLFDDQIKNAEEGFKSIVASIEQKCRAGNVGNLAGEHSPLELASTPHCSTPTI